MVMTLIGCFLTFCLLSDDHRVKGSGLAPWPSRLTAPPPRLADFGYSNFMFEKDTVINWRHLMYFSILSYSVLLENHDYLG